MHSLFLTKCSSSPPETAASSGDMTGDEKKAPAAAAAAAALTEKPPPESSPPPESEDDDENAEPLSSELVARGTLLFVSLLWGTYGIALRAAYGGGASGEAVPTPAELTLARTTIAMLTLGPTLWEYANERRDSSSTEQTDTLGDDVTRYKASALVAGVEIGVWNSLGAGLQAAGLTTTPAARAGFLVMFSAVLTPLFARFIFGQQVTSMAWISCVFALLGCSLITAEDDKPKATMSATTTSASTATTAAAASATTTTTTASPSTPPPTAAPAETISPAKDLTVEQLVPDGGGFVKKLPDPPMPIPPPPPSVYDPVDAGSLVTHFPFLLSLPYDTRKSVVSALEPTAQRLFEPVDGVVNWVGDEIGDLYDELGSDFMELEERSGVHLTDGDVLILLGAAFYAVCTTRISILSAPLDDSDSINEFSESSAEPVMDPNVRARRIVAAKVAALCFCAILWCTWDAVHGHAPSTEWLVGISTTPMDGDNNFYNHASEVIRQNGKTWLLVLYVAWGPGVLASFLQTRGQSVLSAAPSQAILSMTPVWSALLAPPLLHEKGLSQRGWSGAAVVLMAGLLPEFVRLWQEQVPTPSSSPSSKSSSRINDDA